MEQIKKGNDNLFDEIDWDLIYYTYCIKLKRSNEEFWCSPFSQIIKMIDIYNDEQSIKASAMSNKNYESKYFNTETNDNENNNGTVKKINNLKEIF